MMGFEPKLSGFAAVSLLRYTNDIISKSTTELWGRLKFLFLIIGFSPPPPPLISSISTSAQRHFTPANDNIIHTDSKGRLRLCFLSQQMLWPLASCELFLECAILEGLCPAQMGSTCTEVQAPAVWAFAFLWSRPGGPCTLADPGEFAEPAHRPGRGPILTHTLQMEHATYKPIFHS